MCLGSWDAYSNILNQINTKDDLDLSSISESLDFLNDASRGVILVRSSIGRASDL